MVLHKGLHASQKIGWIQMLRASGDTGQVACVLQDCQGRTGFRVLHPGIMEPLLLCLGTELFCSETRPWTEKRGPVHEKKGMMPALLPLSPAQDLLGTKPRLLV